MKKLVCECCGSNDIIKVSPDCFQCESCGVKYKDDDISSLLVEVAEDTIKGNRPKLLDILNNAKRNIENGNWKSGYRLAEEALSIDSCSPEALLYAGMAIGMDNPTKVNQTLSYIFEAIAQKEERSSGEGSFFAFVSEALVCAYHVVEAGLESLARGTYASSFSTYQSESEKQRKEENEQAYRRALARGDSYYARSDSPGITDSVFNSVMAKNDANTIKKQYLEFVRPGIQKITDFMLDRNIKQLSPAGSSAFAHFLAMAYGQKLTISYNKREEKRAEYEKAYEALQHIETIISNGDEKREINKTLSNLEKGIKEAELLDHDGPREVGYSTGGLLFMTIIYCFTWGLSILLFLFAVLLPYKKMCKTGLVENKYNKNAEPFQFTQAMIEKYKKQVLFLGIWSVVGPALGIALLMFIVDKAH